MQTMGQILLLFMLVLHQLTHLKSMGPILTYCLVRKESQVMNLGHIWIAREEKGHKNDLV